MFGFGNKHISEKMSKKNFSEDELAYFKLEETIGKENMEKLLAVFTKKHVSKNPELTLNDLNSFVTSVISDPRRGK